MAKIRALQGIHPQVGMLLLRLCCMPLLNYLAQVVPPSLVAEHFASFDAQVADFVLLLLTLPNIASALPIIAAASSQSPQAAAARAHRASNSATPPPLLLLLLLLLL